MNSDWNESNIAKKKKKNTKRKQRQVKKKVEEEKKNQIIKSEREKLPPNMIHRKDAEILEDKLNIVGLADCLMGEDVSNYLKSGNYMFSHVFIPNNPKKCEKFGNDPDDIKIPIGNKWKDQVVLRKLS